MTINHHITTFAGRPVVAYPPAAGAVPGDPGGVAWRLEATYFDDNDVLQERLDAGASPNGFRRIGERPAGAGQVCSSGAYSSDVRSNVHATPSRAVRTDGGTRRK